MLTRFDNFIDVDAKEKKNCPKHEHEVACGNRCERTCTNPTDTVCHSAPIDVRKISIKIIDCLLKYIFLKLIFILF